MCLTIDPYYMCDEPGCKSPSYWGDIYWSLCSREMERQRIEKLLENPYVTLPERRSLVKRYKRIEKKMMHPRGSHQTEQREDVRSRSEWKKCEIHEAKQPPQSTGTEGTGTQDTRTQGSGTRRRRTQRRGTQGRGTQGRWKLMRFFCIL